MIAQLFAQYNYEYRMMDGTYSGWDAGMMLFGLICMVLFAVGIIYAIKAYKNGYDTHLKPLDIAKERYAKGELTKTEFDQIKKAL